MKKIYAFLMMAAALAACMQMEQPSPIEQPEETVQTYTLTVEAVKGSDTKALTLTDKTLNATWATSEYVYAMKLDAQTIPGHPAPVTRPTWANGSLRPQTDGAEATLSGTLSGFTINYPDELTLQFPRSGNLDYTGQDGTLETIASTYDYATAMMKVKSVDESGNITPTVTPVTFENQQAIVRFTLLDKAGNPIKPTQLTVSPAVNGAEYQYTGQLILSDTRSVVTITPANNTNAATDDDTNVIFAALRGVSNSDLSLTATVGNVTYTYSRPGVTFQHGQYYEVTVKMTPAGAIPGVFSVDGTKKVYFSKGNLQATWNGSAWTWAFAEHQWDYIGAEAGNTSISGNGALSSNGTVDLFGWSTAATTLGIHNATDDSVYYGDFADWGDNDNIKAGIGTGWRTLSRGEWLYLFNYRGDKRYTLGQSIHDVLGIVIYPDNYAGPEYATGNNWATFEAAGCVFLPAAGYRQGTSVNEAGTSGLYWAETSDDHDSAHNMLFNSDDLFINYTAWSRYAGLSVRLVRNAN